MEELDREKEEKMQELMQRQDRMFNWEDDMKRSENAMMEGFRKQKEEMLAKKLADQQKEIIKDMNKADVDAMLERHKRQLLQMDDALRAEQERQLKMMRDKKAGKGKKIAQDKLLRNIKMAEIQKQKAAELEKARLQQAAEMQLKAATHLK